MHRTVIYGPGQSSYVRSARLVAEEKGISYELCEMSEAGQVRWGSSAHLALHPYGKVPALKVGDFTLFETSAICRYLDEIGGGMPLQPDNAEGRALMEQWISAINAYLYADAIKTYVFAYLFPKEGAGGPDPTVIEGILPQLELSITVFDRAYRRNRFLAGPALSIADLLLAPILAYVGALPEGKSLIAAAKHLARAKAEIEGRESFKITAPCGLGRASA